MKTVDLIDRALRKIPKLSLLDGGHDYPFEYTRDPLDRKWGSGDKGTCLMEAVAYIAREEHTDHPKCTAYPLSEFGIVINDNCPSDRFRNKILKPVIPVLLNTSSKDVRAGVREAYPDPHSQKIENFLATEVIKRFDLDQEEYDGAAGVDILQGLLNRCFCSRARCKTLRIAADILKDAACYAREQLGPDVDYPVSHEFLNGILVEEAATDSNVA